MNSKTKYNYVDCNDCTSYDQIYEILSNGVNIIGTGRIGRSTPTNIRDLIGQIGGSNYVNALIRFSGRFEATCLTITAIEIYGTIIFEKYAVNMMNGWKVSDWSSIVLS